MSGPMGAGKSYWCQHYIKTHSRVVYISRDAIRFSLLGPQDEYFSKEKETLKEFRRQAQEAIDDDNVRAVLLDASHLDDRAIGKTLKHLNIPKEIKVINVRVETSLLKCIEQNNLREGRAKVPEEVIRRAYQQFQDSRDRTIDWVRRRIDETWEVC